MTSLDLSKLKMVWNEVLDELEKSNRIAWLAYFDARLVSLEQDQLLLSFADAAKFGGAHDFQQARKLSLRQALQDAIQEVTGASLVIQEI